MAAGLSLICSAPIDAALFTLTPQDRDEAVRVGRRSVTTENWGSEWRVGGGEGQVLTVMTPFHRLALAARNSAFQDKELRPRDVESALKDQQGKVVLWATLRGAKADFARFYTPALVARQQEIKASFTQNERTALRGEDGQLHRALSVRLSRGGRGSAGHRDAPGAGRRREGGGEVHGRSLDHALEPERIPRR